MDVVVEDDDAHHHPHTEEHGVCVGEATAILTGGREREWERERERGRERGRGRGRGGEREKEKNRQKEIIIGFEREGDNSAKVSEKKM